MSNFELRIEQLENRSIQIVPNKNVAASLRSIAEGVGFKLEDKWDSFQIGAKLIDFINENSDENAKLKDTVKKAAVVNVSLVGAESSAANIELRIEQLENRSIQIVPNKNVAATLRSIAEGVGFKLEDKWDSFQIGAKLIDFINENSNENAKLKDSVKKAALIILVCGGDNSVQSQTDASAKKLACEKEDSTDKFFRWSEHYACVEDFDADVENGKVEKDDFSGVSDGAWEWWKKLPINLKALILERFDLIIEFEEGLPLYRCDDEEGIWRDEKGNEVEDEKLWFEDKNTYISYLLTDHICELGEISFTKTERSAHSLTSYDMDKLAYLPNLKHIEFYKTKGYGLPVELMDLPYIKELNYSHTDLDSDSWAALLGFAKTHPQMTSLDISSTPMEDFLAEEPEKVAVLRALMPNCKIESLNSLSEEKADAETVEKHLNTEAVLWWKNADDFSRYVCLVHMHGVIFGRYREKLPTFDESNGFKIVSSELNLDDVWAENGFIWREVNKLFEKEEKLTINLNFENPFANWDKTSFINNKEAYDYSYLNKMFKSVGIYISNPFPVQFSKTKGIKEMEVYSISELPNIEGFDELVFIKLGFSDKKLFPIEEFAKLSKLPNLKTFKLPYDYEEYKDVIKEYFPDTVSIKFGY